MKDVFISFYKVFGVFSTTYLVTDDVFSSVSFDRLTCHPRHKHYNYLAGYVFVRIKSLH